MRIKLFLICVLIVNTYVLKSQTSDFTQIHTNKIYLNPALVGNESCPVATSSYRIKNKDIDGGLSTFFLSYDTYSNLLNNSIGFTILNDNQYNIITTTQISGIYAHTIQIQKNLLLKVGLGIGYLGSQVKYSNRIYSDMLDPFYDEYTQTQEEINTNSTYNSLDLEPGILLYNNSFFAGITCKHAQEVFDHKEISFTQPTIFSFHAGANLKSHKTFNTSSLILLYPHINVIISPTSNYGQIGIVAQKHLLQLGVALRQNFQVNTESFAFFIAFAEKKYKFAYNCELSNNSISNELLNLHELSINYLFNCKTKKKKFEAIKAPTI